MIKSVRFLNWKSFRDATLYIDPLTILIGTNASGKSNAVDGLEFLARMDTVSAEEALNGNQTLPPLRGGAEWAARKPGSAFAIETNFTLQSNPHEFNHRVSISTSPIISDLTDEVHSKTIGRNGFLIRRGELCVDSLKNCGPIANLATSADKFIDLFKRNDEPAKQFAKYIMSEFPNSVFMSYSTFYRYLCEIYIFAPNTGKMQRYSTISDDLLADCSNIAGVLAAASETTAASINEVLTRYVRRLPENDIARIWGEKVGRLGSDAMLYCEEKWGKDGESMIVDSRGMSDGTLRFVAIAVALMTRPAGSLLVIEDVDAGLHPSRAGVLLQMLKEVGRERKVDVLVTTHNPALLDALTPDFVPFVTVAHRDPETGESKLTLVEEMEDLPRLLARGGLGKLAASGALERSLRSTHKPEKE